MQMIFYICSAILNESNLICVVRGTRSMINNQNGEVGIFSEEGMECRRITDLVLQWPSRPASG